MVPLLIGDATRNRKPSCNDRSQTPDHEQLPEQEGKLWKKFLFSSSVSWLEKEISFVYKTRVSARSALPSPTISSGVGHCIRFFACSTVISTLHRKISKNTKKCKSAVFKCFSSRKKKNGLSTKSLERRRSGEHGQSAFGSRSSTTQRPRGRRGHQLARQGSGRREAARATSLLCATPPPGFSGCERRTEFPGKKNQETERAFEALLQTDGP